MGTFIMTHQSYILTLFNEQVDQIWEQLHDDIYNTGKVLYIGSQLEKCPESGRIHWQAFCKFHRQSKQRGSWFKKFHNAIHFQSCSKERSQAIEYGIKAETRVAGPKESGQKPSPELNFTADDCKKCIEEDRVAEIPFHYVLRYNLEKRLPALREFLKLDKRGDLPTFLPNPWGFLLPSKVVGKRRHYWIWSSQPNKGKTFNFAKPLKKEYKAEIITGDTTYFTLDECCQCVIFDEYNTAKFKWDTINAMCDGSYSWRRFNMPSIRLDDPLIIFLSNQDLSVLYPFMNNFLYERINVRYIN